MQDRHNPAKIRKIARVRIQRKQARCNTFATCNEDRDDCRQAKKRPTLAISGALLQSRRINLVARCPFDDPAHLSTHDFLRKVSNGRAGGSIRRSKHGAWLSLEARAENRAIKLLNPNKLFISLSNRSDKNARIR